MKPAICTTPRFLKSFDEAGVLLQKKLLQEVHQFVRYYEADPNTVASHYKTFSGVERHTVLELRLDTKHRALGAWEKRVLTLVDMGNHDHVYDPFCNEVLDSQLPKAEKADREFYPDTSLSAGMFRSTPNRQYERFGNEEDPGWVYFLTSEQNGFVQSMVRQIKKASVSSPTFYFIVGGPGTGKTTILTRLLLDLVRAGRRPGLVATDRVVRYIESGDELDLTSVRLNKWDLYDQAAEHSFDVALFDDPDSTSEIYGAYDKAQDRFRAVVVAFDPCQLGSDFNDAKYDELVQLVGAKPYQLTACYRQKEVVGRAARRVMETVAESTPFLAENKVAEFREAHEQVYRIANTMHYPNRFGYEECYVHATLEDVRREIRRIQKLPLWKHTTPVLLVIQKGLLSDEWDWQKEFNGIPFEPLQIQREGYGRLTEVKGIEFQHAFFVIENDMFVELTDGFQGSGKKLFHQRRLLRIPFSRAKDSIVTFVLEGE